MNLQFHLFGSFEISEDGRPLPKPATLKSQSLLAYLILHRHSPQHRDYLCSLFWGDRPESKARASISTALWHIRRCLPEEDLIWKDGETLQFSSRADLWLDVDEFSSLIAAQDISSLSAAVEHYRGELLAGFYDDWIVDERYHLESLYCTALLQLMAHQEASANYTEALAAGRRLLQCDPLREEAHRLIMRAQSQLGQRNAALMQYQTCREMLHSQLGVEPMEETTALYHAILRERQAMPLAPATPFTQMLAFVTPAHPGYDPLDVTSLGHMVGRENELGLLNKYWVDTKSGHGKFVFLGGEAGVGKTRLVEEFINGLRFQGIRILSGRCYQFERVLPYQPVFEALKSVLPSVAVSEQTLFPHWLVSDDCSLSIQTSGDGPSQQGLPEHRCLFEDVRHFLNRLAQRGPLLFVIEDLHWLTESTMQLLHYLVRHLLRHPILWIGTYRKEELAQQDSLLNFMQILRKENISASINLNRLSAADVETLIAEMSGAGSVSMTLARRLYQETEGNPFFLMEMLKTLFETGALRLEAGEWKEVHRQISQGQLPLPQSVRDVILSRVRALTEDTQNALQVAAVLGREFDYELLDQAWGRGREATLEALDVLLRQRFIEEGRGIQARDYIFIHHKIPEVIYDAMPQPRREMLHAKAARAWEKLALSAGEPVAGEIAHHFERCHELDPAYLDGAVRYLLKAGDRARFLYAFQDALDYYQRALALLRKVKWHDRAADTLMKMGLTYYTRLDFERSRQAYEEGLALRRVSQPQIARLPPAPHPLRVSWREPNSLDPALASFEWSLRIIDQLFCGLVDITPDLDILPNIAHAWEVLDGGRKYVFHLRKDVKWSDGTQVTAGDFEYAWKRALLPAHNFIYTELLEDIRGAKSFHQGKTCNPNDIAVWSEDGLTLQVELEEPNGYFLYVLPYLFPIPRHVVTALGTEWAQPQNIVTNGPFRLETWSPGDSIVLSRNAHYHGEFSGNVEQIKLCLHPSMPAQLDLYEAGRLDFFDMWTLPLEERDRARQRNHADFISLPEISTFFLGFDVGRPPFDDPRLRRAFALATDREKLSNVVMRGCVEPATGGLIPLGMLAHSPGIGLPCNVNEARQLLSEAGDLDHWRALFSRMDALLPSGSLVPYAHSLQAQWKEHLGIDIAWRILDPDACFNRLQNDIPPMYLIGWMPDCPDPGSLFPSSRVRQYTHWQSNRYDALLKEAKQTIDQTARARLYQDADRMLIQETVFVPLTYGRNLLLVKPWIKELSSSPLTRWLWKDIVIEPH